MIRVVGQNALACLALLIYGFLFVLPILLQPSRSGKELLAVLDVLLIIHVLKPQIGEKIGRFFRGLWRFCWGTLVVGSCFGLLYLLFTASYSFLLMAVLLCILLVLIAILMAMLKAPPSPQQNEDPAKFRAVY
jgi:hypothetical protein